MNSTIAIQETSWREQWFVRNILTEIPVLGSFIKIRDYWSALYDAGKCVAMLGGGAVLGVALPPPADSSSEYRVAHMAATMGAGGFLVKAAYISTVAAAEKACLFSYSSCCKVQANKQDEIPIEAQHLNPPSPPV